MFNSRSKRVANSILGTKILRFFSHYSKFKLPNNFLTYFKNKPVNFGFNGLGELVYKRTYSRVKEDDNNEEWFETVQRVIEGTYSLLM